MGREEGREGTGMGPFDMGTNVSMARGQSDHSTMSCLVFVAILVFTDL